MHIKNEELRILADALRDDKLAPCTQLLIFAAMFAPVIGTLLAALL